MLILAAKMLKWLYCIQQKNRIKIFPRVLKKLLHTNSGLGRNYFLKNAYPVNNDLKIKLVLFLKNLTRFVTK